MKNLREIFTGVLFALLTALIVLGALTLSLVEGMAAPTLPTETPFELPTYLLAQTPIPIDIGTITPTATTTCPKPAGWVEYVVQFGDDFDRLALEAGLSAAELREANCLLSTELVPGTVLFLPQPDQAVSNTPSPTVTESRCGPPAGWILYRIQAEDTLFRISLNYGVSVPQLQYANCMGSSTLLRVGDTLYVPNVATRTPTLIATFAGTNTPTQTSTTEMKTATATPSPTTTPTTESTAVTVEYPAP